MNDILSRVRRGRAKKYGMIDPAKLEFLWVVDFPLLSWNAEEKRLDFKPSSFYGTKESDIPLLDTEPLKVKARALTWY